MIRRICGTHARQHKKYIIIFYPGQIFLQSWTTRIPHTHSILVYFRIGTYVLENMGTLPLIKDKYVQI